MSIIYIHEYNLLLEDSITDLQVCDAIDKHCVKRI